MKDFDFTPDFDDILAEFGASADVAHTVDELPEKAAESSERDAEPSERDAELSGKNAEFSEIDGEPAEPPKVRKPLRGSAEKPRPENSDSGKEESAEEMKPVRPRRQVSSHSRETVRKGRPTGEEIVESAEKAAKKTVSGLKRFVMAFTGLVFSVVSVAILAWMLINIHPDSAMASSQLTLKKRSDIVSRLDTYSNNMKGELLGELTYIRKQYKIPEGDLVAPLAPGYNYGSTMDPAEVLAVIEEAREYGLLDGQDVVFNENADFYFESPIKYYCDETLLAICWKELIDNRIVACMEVKIADGSQIRRKLAEDTYGSSQYVYATELAAQCNAVAAINADYYAFRDLGITVYDRRLYRFDDGPYSGKYEKYNATDTLFVNGSGDFLTFRMGEKTTREEMEAFVRDNDIIFAIAFGPVLVDEWTRQWYDWYPIGETDKEYSRAGIAQYDTLHYLYMTVSFADNGEYHPRCTVNEFAGIMEGKGVRLGYCLDGGQTGELVFNGEPYNHIDFGTERTVSDIIYFASAIPESER